MLKINFYSDYDNPELIKEAKVYQNIWDSEKYRVVDAFKKITGLEFKENEINAVVFMKGIPRSHPLSFRAGEPEWLKKSVIVHELAHRIMAGNNIKAPIRDFEKPDIRAEDVHRFINLYLYDVWTELYGIEFADKSVEHEKGLRPLYENAWEWAMQFNKEERVKKFAEIVERSKTI